MAGLPSQHPSLAIHMTDRATTPLISSASLTPSTPSSSKPQAAHHQRQQPQLPHHPKQRKRQTTTFSTSPPASASASPSSSTPSSAHDDNDEPPSPASRQAAALTSLSATALLSYDAAKRLGRGAPLRTMVEYPDAGPVVLHSYMCPMGLALGVPGRNATSSSSSSSPSSSRAASLHSAAVPAGSAPGGSVNGGGDHDHNHDDVGGGGGGGGGDGAGGRGSGLDAATRADGGDHRGRPSRQTPTRPLSFALDPAGDDGGGGDTEGIDPSDPPMLTSTVVAPRADDLREARRATARLEKVARVFQAEWVATGRR